MDIYHGANFAEFCLEQFKIKDLLNRAVKKGIITKSGAFYLEHL